MGDFDKYLAEALSNDEELRKEYEALSNDGEYTIKWKDYNIEKPNKSGVYKIKAKAPYEIIDAAYYNAHDDRWIEDDGWWLPVDITSSVTHWR